MFATISQQNGMVTFTDNPERYNSVQMYQQIENEVVYFENWVIIVIFYFKTANQMYSVESKAQETGRRHYVWFKVCRQINDGVARLAAIYHCLVDLQSRFWFVKL